MATAAIDLSSGLVPRDQNIDLSAGLQPKAAAPTAQAPGLNLPPGGSINPRTGQIQRDIDPTGNFTKAALAGAGSMVAPELLPEMAGSGLLGFLGRVLARSAAAGGGAGVGTMAGQAAQGQNPVAPQNLAETGRVAGTTALVSAPFEALGAAAQAKMGRALINRSVGAAARDVTYGNPARAIEAEAITAPSTGDLEAYKDALRAGKAPDAAAQAAGGRFAQVNQKINQLAPQVSNALSKSTARIRVADAIDQPLNDAAMDIIDNHAVTDDQKLAAITQLGGLQKSLKEGLGDTITPLEANKIKQQIGDRVNWGGTVAVTDEVKPAYRAVYGSLNNHVTKAVPEVAGLNERLTNLYAAQSDLKRLMQREEVDSGPGMTSGGMSGIVGRLEAEAGRFLPAASRAARTAGRMVRTAVPGLTLSSLLGAEGDQ